MKKKIFVFLICLLCAIVLFSVYRANKTDYYKTAQSILEEQTKAIMTKDYSAFKSLYKQSISQKALEQLSGINKINDQILSVHKYGKKLLVDMIREVYSTSRNEKVYTTMVLEETPAGWKIDTESSKVPVKNPNIVVGNDIGYEDIAKTLAENTQGKLFHDYDFLATYGDAVIVGTPWDNALIAMLHKQGKAKVAVTQTFPGPGIGVIQQVKGVCRYRNLILIGASDKKGLENAARYLDGYLRRNIDFEGKEVIYVKSFFGRIYEAKIASPHEQKMDTAKYDEVIKNAATKAASIADHLEQANKDDEAQIEKIKSELEDDMELDYLKEAFALWSTGNKLITDIGMVVTPADMISPETTRIALEIYQGKNINSVENYIEFVRNNMMHTDILMGQNVWKFYRKSPITEMMKFKADFGKISGDCYALSCLSTAIMRTLGFSSKEVFNVNIDSHVINFLSLDGDDYVFDPTLGDKASLAKYYRLMDNLERISNDTIYLNLYKYTSDMPKEESLQYIRRIYNLVECAKRDEGLYEKGNFTQEPLIYDKPIEQDIEALFSKMEQKGGAVTPEAPYDLEQSLERLRSEAAEFLSNQAEKQLLLLSKEMPESQYTLARYALGDISVKKTQAYALAALEAPNTQQKAGALSGKDIEKDIASLTNILREIQTIDSIQDKISYPDYLLISKKGTPWDKALLAFGILKNRYKDIEAYVVLTDDNGYLALKTNEWTFIDCKNNAVLNDSEVNGAELVFSEKDSAADMADLLK